MTKAMSMFTRFTQSRYAIPTAVAAAGIAYYTLASRPLYNEANKVFKGDDQWIDLKLIKTEQLTHDTKHLTFQYPNKDDVSGLVTASCVLTKYVTAKGNNVVRPYTPVSDPSQVGTVDFVIKGYPSGKMSKHITELKEGETLSFKGPVVKWKWEPNQFDSIALIGGGSGITPLWQLVHTITQNPDDKTLVQLYYGSQTTEDIILKKELDELAKNHPQVKIHYFVDKLDSEPSTEANLHQGYITKEFLQKTLPPVSASQKSKIFVCGPPPLYKSISGMKNSPTDQGEVTGALAELGYTKENVFKF
ncbi:NADH-cytochrome b5 reductase 2 [Diutina catenulata]